MSSVQCFLARSEPILFRTGVRERTHPNDTGRGALRSGKSCPVQGTRRQLPKFPAMGLKEPVSRPQSEEGARNSSGAGHEKRHLLVDRYIQQSLLAENETSGVRCAQRCGIQRWSSTSTYLPRAAAYEFAILDEAEQYLQSIVETPSVPIDAGFPVMPSYRVAHPYFATNSVIYSPKTLATPGCACRPSFRAGFSNITLPGFNPGSCREKFSCMLTAATMRSRCFGKMGHSDSRKTNTRFCKQPDTFRGKLGKRCDGNRNWM